MKDCCGEGDIVDGGVIASVDHVPGHRPNGGVGGLVQFCKVFKGSISPGATHQEADCAITFPSFIF